MEFLSECSTRDVNRSLRWLERSRVEHQQRNSTSPSNQVLFGLSYKHLTNEKQREHNAIHSLREIVRETCQKLFSSLKHTCEKIIVIFHDIRFFAVVEIPKKNTPVYIIKENILTLPLQADCSSPGKHSLLKLSKELKVQNMWDMVKE